MKLSPFFKWAGWALLFISISHCLHCLHCWLASIDFWFSTMCGTYVGALGAATVGNFGAEVAGNGRRDYAGAELVEGMRQQAIEGGMEDGDEFLKLLGEHKEVHPCKI